MSLYGLQNERDARDLARIIRRERNYGSVEVIPPIVQDAGGGGGGDNGWLFASFSATNYPGNPVSFSSRPSPNDTDGKIYADAGQTIIGSVVITMSRRASWQDAVIQGNWRDISTGAWGEQVAVLGGPFGSFFNSPGQWMSVAADSASFPPMPSITTVTVTVPFRGTNSAGVARNLEFRLFEPNFSGPSSAIIIGQHALYKVVS